MSFNLRKNNGDFYLKLWILVLFYVLMRKKLLKWFTLLEMIITMVIVWILAVVLIESYMTISKIALKVEQQKHLSEEALTLTQIFQSMSDEATIDYEKYEVNNIDLEQSDWYYDRLYLTWWVWSGISIYTTGACLDLDGNFEFEDGKINNSIQDYTGCSLVMKQWENWEEIQLTTLWKVVISKVIFRIIPFNSDENYFKNGEEWEIIVNDIHQPAFWLFMHLYAPLYQPIWVNNIDLPLQLFFNLNV